MTTVTYKAGQEIDAFCTKCKMDLGHRIVAVAGGKPAKAECLTCRGVHMYRAPKHAPKPVAGAKAGAKAGSGGYLERIGAPASKPPSRSAKAAPKVPVIDDGPLIPPDSQHIFLYKTTERYAPQTWVSHKTFGIGRVERELGPNKIEVRFEGGARVLVHDLAPL